MNPTKRTISKSLIPPSLVRAANRGEASLDVDDNGSAEAFEDGVAIIRDMAGMTNAALAAGNAIDSSGNRGTAPLVSNFLNQNDVQAMLDADGNGQIEPLADGILILRYLAGITGNDLTDGAVGNGATRTTATAIIGFLDGFLPNSGPSNAAVPRAAAALSTPPDDAEEEPTADDSHDPAAEAAAAAVDTTACPAGSSHDAAEETDESPDLSLATPQPQQTDDLFDSVFADLVDPLTLTSIG